MLKVGAAKCEITPNREEKLAGYFTLRSRTYQRVLDPIYVRAIAFEQGSVRSVLVVFDLLLITPEMTARIQTALEPHGARALCIATHTHSAHGGYWEPLAARLALGPHREGTLDALVAAATEAATNAIADLQPAKTAIHSRALPDVAVNRRNDKESPDDRLWALRLARDSDDIVLCGFAAHPVVVAERDFLSLSADFPGRVVAQLEERVAFAAFVNGPVGGTGTFLTDGVSDANESLALQADPIAAAAIEVMDVPLRDDATLRFASRELHVPKKPTTRAAFDDQTMGKVWSWPLDQIANWLFGEVSANRALIQALAVGDAVLVGTPADLGIDVGRAIRDAAIRHGFGEPFVASQADGYIGYIHRRDNYRQRPSSTTLAMAMYENIMGIYGHDMGETLIDEANELLASLVASEANA